MLKEHAERNWYKFNEVIFLGIEKRLTGGCTIFFSTHSVERRGAT